LILGYGSPTHSHMPLSETTPDSDLLSCLRRYTIGFSGYTLVHMVHRNIIELHGISWNSLEHHETP
jgi:hypothetical protein